MRLFGSGRTQQLLIKELASDPYMLRRIPSNSMGFFVDIGAQAGVVSVMFRLMNNATKMYAVEPDPLAFEMLSDNTKALNVTCIRKALGDGKNFALNPPEKRTTLGVEYVEVEKDMINVVQSARLSDLLDEMNKLSLTDINPRETMFKIDCEGGEAYIVDHVPSLLILKEARVIAFELHNGKRTLEEYFAILESLYADTHNIIRVKQNKDRSANWMLIRKDVTLG